MVGFYITSYLPMNNDTSPLGGDSMNTKEYCQGPYPYGEFWSVRIGIRTGARIG